LRAPEVSIFFFSGDGGGNAPDKYRLLLECARIAERNGFAAIWVPERHFTKFGGLFPNPSVLAAALAATTSRIQLRAGSVVLTLHDPLRVAEEWSVVDNLSGGRVGVAFASGWHPDDFVLAADRYSGRKPCMYHAAALVRRLWRGEAVTLPNGQGRQVEVRTFPKAIQPELPVWLTAIDAETFVKAGEIGANVLTGLMGRDLEDCVPPIAAYRQAWRAHGWDPDGGIVTMMLHTYVGSDLAAVKNRVRGPMREYLRAFLETSEHDLRAKPGVGSIVAELTADDRDALLDHTFEQYFAHRALLGTPASCQRTLARLTAAGVNEVACLLDFGLEPIDVIEGLESLSSAITMFRESLAATA
jgi:natural product biosynthesis luciferase-like monooxygenase protein